MLTDKQLLKFAGVLGHTVIVVKDVGPNERSATFHTCSLTSAREYAEKEAAGDNPKIYKRNGKGWMDMSFIQGNGTVKS